MALITKAPRGTEDKLPQDIYKWHTVEKITRAVAESYGCKEIRTPTFEHTDLFLRGVGSTTDVVQKEMYTFNDKKGRSITLKPEGTAGAVRASLEHGLLSAALPLKLFYYTSCFRYENPQSGRLREHRQFGVEMFGAGKPLADAELISLAANVIGRLGLKDISLEINSIGCSVCRKKYLTALRKYFAQYKEELCGTCTERLEKNPMRLLDCKVEHCREKGKYAPVIIEYLCGDCEEHFDSVKKSLINFNIDFSVNPRLVRGLDYYTNTVFEFISNQIGSQGTICAGGRYNGLVEELGGASVTGLGFGMGLERIILVMEAQGLYFEPETQCDIYIAGLDNDSCLYAAKLVKDLRDYGFWAECDLTGRSLKAQMKYADKIGARFSMVVGSSETEAGRAVLKNMQSGEKFEVDIKGNFAEKINVLLLGTE